MTTTVGQPVGDKHPGLLTNEERIAMHLAHIGDSLERIVQLLEEQPMRVERAAEDAQYRRSHAAIAVGMTPRMVNAVSKTRLYPRRP
jgi:hypothetical protein